MAVSSLRPYVVVFTASACTLVIEIVAGRVLAPAIGVSLYTWTSIIGIVLAGISVGNYLGGRIADRRPSGSTLGVLLLAAGVSSLSILPAYSLVSGLFGELPLLVRIVLLTTVLFFVPSLILGMVAPVAIKLRLSDLAETGNVVGKVYAVSTAGSIVGTFLTGFLLVQLFGSRVILVVVGLVLVCLALAFGDLWRGRVPGTALLAGLVGMAGTRSRNQKKVGGIIAISSLRPYVVVFTASACVLIIEIVAGRILAPAVGVSLFTWTSIIGITLAGHQPGKLPGRQAGRPQAVACDAGLGPARRGDSQPVRSPGFRLSGPGGSTVRHTAAHTAGPFNHSPLLGTQPGTRHGDPDGHQAGAGRPRQGRQRRRQDIRGLDGRQHPRHVRGGLPC